MISVMILILLEVEIISDDDRQGLSKSQAPEASFF